MTNDNTGIHNFLAEETAARLDKFVAGKFPQLSRTRVQKLISGGYIKVNGQITKAGAALGPGDRIEIALPPAETGAPEAEDIPLNILYEDNDVLVIDKPAGLTVHPAPGHSEHTLVNAILARTSRLPDTGDSLRPGIVHRLDKDTSGVMLVARSEAAYSSLIDQFKSRSVKKIYRVLVRGHLSPESGIIEAPIGRDPRRRQRMAVVEEGKGKEARTDYRVIEYAGEYTLLEITLKTGRTHQIRVHLAAIGYPVAGDSVYGVKSPFISRQFVHASCLGFKLPSTGEYAEFTSPLPADLEKALGEIRLS
jgi:23S rRNA pseudouridine1911/1915/1917 synthase